MTDTIPATPAYGAAEATTCQISMVWGFARRHLWIIVLCVPLAVTAAPR